MSTSGAYAGSHHAIRIQYLLGSGQSATQKDTAMPEDLSHILRSRSRIDPTSGCQLWEGARDPKGYGRVFVYGVGNQPAHRVAYQIWRGDILAGEIVRHRCDTPPCIRPHHLIVGTHADNTQDRIERHGHPTSRIARRSTCINGHVKYRKNVGFRTNGSPYCIRCHHAVLVALAAEVGEVLS